MQENFRIFSSSNFGEACLKLIISEYQINANFTVFEAFAVLEGSKCATTVPTGMALVMFLAWL